MCVLSMRSFANPLDALEEAVQSYVWRSTRETDDSLTLEVPGRWAIYPFHFRWLEEFSLLGLSIPVNLIIESTQSSALVDLATNFNRNLLMGHVVVSETRTQVSLCHAILVGDTFVTSPGQLESLIHFFVQTCDRLYPAIESLKDNLMYDTQRPDLFYTAVGEA